MAYGDKPYGLRDIKLKSGAQWVDLPVARRLTFKPRMSNATLEGDDIIAESVSKVEGYDLTLEAGGISLEAYAMLTGVSVTETGTAPNRTKTYTFTQTDNLPYIEIYGQSIGAGDDGMKVHFFRCKIKDLQGSMGNKEFLITSCQMDALADPVTGKFIEIIQEETATPIQ